MPPGHLIIHLQYYISKESFQPSRTWLLYSLFLPPLFYKTFIYEKITIERSDGVYHKEPWTGIVKAFTLIEKKKKKKKSFGIFSTLYLSSDCFLFYSSLWLTCFALHVCFPFFHEILVMIKRSALIILNPLSANPTKWSNTLKWWVCGVGA